MRFDFYLRSSAARLAITYMMMFMVSVVLLGMVTYTTLERSIEARDEQEAEDELSHFLQEYHEGGIKELRDDIASHLREYPNSKYLYFLSDVSERQYFSDIKNFPRESGKRLVELEHGEEILLLTRRLDQGYVLGVGSERSHLDGLRRAMQQNFALALLFALLIGMLGSVMMGRRFQLRVEAFNRTAERVGAGALGERIPMSEAQDDFDDLALIINGMLERIERLVGSVRRVTANVAHDMRTPLGRIRQSLEEIQRSSPSLAEALEEVIGQLDESLMMFAAILSIAEVETSGDRFIKVGLTGLLTRLAEMYTPVAEDTGVLLALDLGEHLWVMGDEALLIQALANLIENALNHAQAATLTLSAQARGEEVIIKVCDDGVGIPEQELAHVTEPFYRLDSSRTSPGHGLGLSLVAAIVAAHDAQLIFVSRQPGLEVNLVCRRVLISGG